MRRFDSKSNKWQVAGLVRLRAAGFATAFVLVFAVGFDVARGLAAERSDAASGDVVIRAPAGDSEIVITTTSRLAGAVHSLTWGGREFIDSVDHGRQLQSACSFGDRRAFVAETFNPTEAGSRSDGAGGTSTSRLLHRTHTSTSLQTTTQMAFWLQPGQRSAGQLACNTTALSNHLITKQIRLGAHTDPHVIAYDATFTVPVGEQYPFAQFEALTGYMPADFSQFWAYDTAQGALVSLDDGPGEQARPVVLATQSGTHAMGIFSPDQPAPGYEHAGYGRFRFAAQRVVKWNCVFRVQRDAGILPGPYHYRCLVLVGDLATIEASLRNLTREALEEPRESNR